MNFSLKQGFNSAFTMIEIIFVIVILGILSSVAISRFAVSRDDAQLIKAKNDIAAIRSSIVTKRSQNILSGKGAKYPELNSSSSTNELFGNVLDYPIYAKNQSGHWRSTDNTTYFFNLAGTQVQFDYNQTTGAFDCDHKSANIELKKACQQLAE